MVVQGRDGEAMLTCEVYPPVSCAALANVPSIPSIPSIPTLAVRETTQDRTRSAAPLTGCSPRDGAEGGSSGPGGDRLRRAAA